MQKYPIFLSLRDFQVLVVGAGSVGKRKITALCKCGAGDILVLDPGLPPSHAKDLADLPNVRVECRSVCEEDVRGKLLVFAATNDKAENGRIGAMCTALKVPCNIVDDPESSTFHVPARTRAAGIAAAFSSDGKSPALAKRIKDDAGGWLEANYGPLLRFMARLRPLVLALGEETENNTFIFRAVTYSRLGEVLAEGDLDAAREIAEAVLPESLHKHIEELLHGTG